MIYCHCLHGLIALHLPLKRICLLDAVRADLFWFVALHDVSMRFMKALREHACDDISSASTHNPQHGCPACQRLPALVA